MTDTNNTGHLDLGTLGEPYGAAVVHLPHLEATSLHAWLRARRQAWTDQGKPLRIAVLADSHLGADPRRLNILRKAVLMTGFDLVAILGEDANAWSALIDVPVMEGKPKFALNAQAVAARTLQLAAIKGQTATQKALSDSRAHGQLPNTPETAEAMAVIESCASGDTLLRDVNIGHEPQGGAAATDEIPAADGAPPYAGQGETIAPTSPIQTGEAIELATELATCDTSTIQDERAEELPVLEAGAGKEIDGDGTPADAVEVAASSEQMQDPMSEEADQDNAPTAQATAEQITQEGAEETQDDDNESDLIETERFLAEQAEATRQEIQRIAAEQQEAEQAEADRLAAEQAREEREEAQRQEAEDALAAQQAEVARVEAERAEAERREAERVAAEQAEAERLEAERAQQAQAEAARQEEARLAALREEAVRQEAQRQEAARLAAEEEELERARQAQAAGQAFDPLAAQDVVQTLAETARKPAVPSWVRDARQETDGANGIPNLATTLDGLGRAAGARVDTKPRAQAPHRVAGIVRTGTVIEHDGDIIIEGSVHSGAEIRASGDIHVYGIAGGRLFAGSKGDRSACLYLHRFDAELVSIAGRGRLFEEAPKQWKRAPVKIHFDTTHGILRFEPLTLEIPNLRRPGVPA